jgi:hypothetical protein
MAIRTIVGRIMDIQIITAVLGELTKETEEPLIGTEDQVLA